MMVEVCGDLLDLSCVVEVSKLHGDHNWRRYDVFFNDGRKKFYYRERDADSLHLKREEFIEILKLNSSEQVAAL